VPNAGFPAPSPIAGTRVIKQVEKLCPELQAEPSVILKSLNAEGPGSIGSEHSAAGVPEKVPTSGAAKAAGFI
jgi:hypothetical protein